MKKPLHFWIGLTMVLGSGIFTPVVFVLEYNAGMLGDDMLSDFIFFLFGGIVLGWGISWIRPEKPTSQNSESEMQK